MLPIQKSDTKLEINNYSPISLLTSNSKIILKTMHSRLYNYLQKFKLLYDKRFEFPENFSTVNALAEITERIWLGVDKNIKCCFLSI